MRLWSLHPKHLDPKGLVALWREGLLARCVLEGRTRGYHRHPQLVRFRQTSDPIVTLDGYLRVVLEEGQRRGYRFDAQKIVCQPAEAVLEVTKGQLEYEWRHLLNKLSLRQPDWWERQRQLLPEPHPCFHLVQGPVAPWEVAARRSAGSSRAPASRDSQRSA